jgi:hypothetical protein
VTFYARPDAHARQEVDQSNFDKRTGYDPDFLGSAGLSVPLPRVADQGMAGQVLKFESEAS